MSHGSCLLVCFGILVVPLAAQIVPKRGVYDESTGLLQAKVSGASYRGSGVVARDPRLIYSCAHVLYENGVWAESYRFHRAYHAATPPVYDDGMAPRGFRYFTSYATNAALYGGDSARTYAYDFVVLYSDKDFGKAVGWWYDGASVLGTDRWKRIVGYPSMLTATGVDGGYYQHGTEWFQNGSSYEYGAYHQINGVTSGKGNSGGPLFVWDAESDDDYLAGILVSGDASLSGFHALSEATHQMANDALGLELATKRFSNKSAVRLRDHTKKYTRRNVTVRGFSDRVEKLRCNIDIRTRRRGDLDVFLKSPTGRIRWINKASSAAGKNIRFKGKDFTSSFKGYAANGKWSLRMRDIRKGTRARFNSISLKVTALAE